MILTAQTHLLIVFLLPFIGALLIYLFGKTESIRNLIVITSAALLPVFMLSLAYRFLEGEILGLVLLPFLENTNIGFNIEPIGLLFACIVSVLWPFTALYSSQYMQENGYENLVRFFSWFSISIGCALGVAFSNNLITLFIFYELLSLCTYPLVAHKQDSQSKAKARIYLAILLGTSLALFLPAIIWTWTATGTLEFTPGGILAGKVSETNCIILLLLFLLGVSKVAMMPVHKWLPSAMVAPTPISALLHAVAVVKAGAFTIIKITTYIFGFNLLASMQTEWLIYLTCITLVLASYIALLQDNLKLRLAYSTISQLSYITLGALLAHPLALAGAIFHLVAHAFGKIILFFAAGAISTKTSIKRVSQMDGIGKIMPWTMGCFAIGAVSMIGIPPFSGFISKWYLLQGAISSTQYVAVIALVIGTLLNTAYFVPVLYSAFFKELKEDLPIAEDKNKAPGMIIAIVFAAAVTILLFFFPNIIIDNINALTSMLT
jgi:multicomponent Na+:H+ antiporter subunit D